MHIISVPDLKSWFAFSATSLSKYLLKSMCILGAFIILTNEKSHLTSVRGEKQHIVLEIKTVSTSAIKYLKY